ncbi:MAG: hypothetical protein DCC49_12315 [Acidobacteria bacterium]|nr:MAG: hypothetical protein DCC49_12315 [Acidobacteriota bacterium]
MKSVCVFRFVEAGCCRQGGEGRGHCVGGRYNARMSEDLVSVGPEPLSIDRAVQHISSGQCGAMAIFVGTVRDSSDGRDGVISLDYEAYPGRAEEALHRVAEATRAKVPELHKIALLHRTGNLEVGEASVIVAVSTPHRADSFEAARFAIDTLKEEAPIWKKETWEDGSAWVEGSVT